MAVEIPNDVLAALIAAVIKIEKKYAHELTGVRNDRREDIKRKLTGWLRSGSSNDPKTHPLDEFPSILWRPDPRYRSAWSTKCHPHSR